MRIYNARLLLASILLLANIIPDMHALTNPPLEDLDLLLQETTTRRGFIDSVDDAYVRHPLLCTVGFTIVSFVMLYIINPEVRKRVHKMVRRVVGEDVGQVHEADGCIERENLHH